MLFYRNLFESISKSNIETQQMEIDQQTQGSFKYFNKTKTRYCQPRDFTLAQGLGNWGFTELLSQN